MKPRIFVTRSLPKKVMVRLEEDFEVIGNPYDRSLSKTEIITGMKGCRILLCLLNDIIDRDVIESNPELVGISNYAVGYNNIDLKAASERNIYVTNTPGVLTETTADLTWALLMAIARRIVEADSFARAGKFKGWAPMLMLGNDIFGKTLGIIGTGRIGAAVARRSLGFKMELLYHDKIENSSLISESNARYVALSELIKRSDFITLHLPLTSETQDLIGETEFELMKNTACLINTSRGKIIDEIALVHALRKAKIAGAALDVFYNEPAITEELINLPNVVLSPHIGSASIETRTKMGLLAARNARDIIMGKNPQAIVNPEVLSK